MKKRLADLITLDEIWEIIVDGMMVHGKYCTPFTPKRKVFPNHSDCNTSNKELDVLRYTFDKLFVVSSERMDDSTEYDCNIHDASFQCKHHIMIDTMAYVAYYHGFTMEEFRLFVNDSNLDEVQARYINAHYTANK